MLYRTTSISLEQLQNLKNLCKIYSVMKIEAILATALATSTDSHSVTTNVFTETQDLLETLEPLSFCEGILLTQGKASGVLALSPSRFQDLQTKLQKQLVSQTEVSADMQDKLTELELSRKLLITLLDGSGFVESNAARELSSLTTRPSDSSVN